MQLLHLDGYRPDIVQSMLSAGQLPNLELLAARGRVSYQATTVDKSETMKVIQSYLTSQLDTSVVGWWQFNRDRFHFTNYWLDPAEVLNYALGLQFPTSPTLQDFLAFKGHNLVAGMSLARRSVPFDNYGRAYVEGARAVSSHEYHAQARATMTSFLSIHDRIAAEGEPSPALSALLLAAADEFSHVRGVTSDANPAEQCFGRGEAGMDPTLFERLDEGPGLSDVYFSRVRRSALSDRIEQVCFALPERDGRAFEPFYALSMIVIDIELGRLIDRYRGIKDAAGVSLFERTLFIVFGDHGMVDTPRGMRLIEALNEKLDLDTGSEGVAIPATAELGIDDTQLPRRLVAPESYPEWQSPLHQALTTEASLWAQDLVQDLRSLVLDDLHESYWWLFFLRSLLIDPKLDSELGPVTERALAAIRRLFLRSDVSYLQAESLANEAYFDRHVRLVYGGGARNNAELFLPFCEAGSGCDWSRRPDYDQITTFRGGSDSSTTLLEALAELQGVGLIFIRRNNDAFDSDAPLPERLEVEVRDRSGNQGFITATRDATTAELVFHYRTGQSSRDPLGYEPWGLHGGTHGTYNEWNDRTIDAPLVNVVGGMGAYLFSNNPAIGDVVVTHSDGWNFGDNLGGHGGVHREEKKTFLLVSGPDVTPGELLARSRSRTNASGEIVSDGGGTHVPTLLDIVPTALTWLGYSRHEMDRFAADDFEAYLDGWIRSQHGDVMAHLQTMPTLERAKAEADLSEMSLEPVMPKIARLLSFMDARREETLQRLDWKPLLGNELILND